MRVAEVILPSLTPSLPFQKTSCAGQAAIPRLLGLVRVRRRPCWPSQVPSRAWMVRHRRRPRGGTGPGGVRRVVTYGGCPTRGAGGPVERKIHRGALAWGSEPQRVK